MAKAEDKKLGQPSFEELEGLKKDEQAEVEPKVEPKVEPEKEPAPKKLSPRLVCVETFGQFGKTYFPGDEVTPDETWPEGTLQRRLDGGFVKFVGL